SLALEFKRANEGIHGLLTAIGQAFAYVHKGYSGVVIAIPSLYETHERPGDYVKEVLDRVNSGNRVGVFVYRPPDTSAASPFRGKLECKRCVRIDLSIPSRRAGIRRVETQWAHLREGSSFP